MEGPYSSSLSIAAAATALCFLFALWFLRSAFVRPRGRGTCGCECAIDRRETAVGEAEAAAAAERQAGGSMMEQLVPEITTHALSYLDYTSLCRLSMTNSATRRAANDDGACLTLHHKEL